LCSRIKKDEPIVGFFLIQNVNEHAAIATIRYTGTFPAQEIIALQYLFDPAAL